MVDIFLYPGEATANDVKLRDPTKGGITYYGVLKEWTGSIWTKKILKVYWSGSWQNKPLKRWSGSTWLLVNNTGV